MRLLTLCFVSIICTACLGEAEDPRPLPTNRLDGSLFDARPPQRQPNTGSGSGYGSGYGSGSGTKSFGGTNGDDAFADDDRGVDAALDAEENAMDAGLPTED